MLMVVVAFGSVSTALKILMLVAGRVYSWCYICHDGAPSDITGGGLFQKLTISPLKRGDNCRLSVVSLYMSYVFHYSGDSVQ